MAPAEDKPADDGDQSYMLSKDRVRREKKDKGGRQALLAKMKQARTMGEKFKAEVKEEDDGIYDIVDEDEYSEIVRQRQDENFIVDDDGSGYIEDGREIFDDDLHEVSAAKSRHKGSSSTSSRTANGEATKAGTRNLKAMFAANAVKKAKVDQDVSLKDDEALDDILNALKNENETATDSFRKPLKEAARPAIKLFGKVVEPVPATASTYRVSTVTVPHPPAALKRPPETETVVVRPPPPQASVATKTEAVSVIEDSVSIESFDSFSETEVAPAVVRASAVDADLDAAEFEAMDFEDFAESADFGECETNGSAAGKPQKVAIKIEPDVVNDAAFMASWMDVKEFDEPIPDASVECSKLPLVINDKGEQVLRFYLLDAYDDYFKQPGVVYLFGKVEVGGTHVSCCVTVKNIQRRVFLLPREKKVDVQPNQETADPVTMADVHAEFNHDIAPKYKINTFRARHTKKKYAFQKSDVPSEATYLEVRYPAEFGELSADLKGATFSAIFGTNTSSLEILLLDLKIKGPSWLEIRMPRVEPTPVSWCKLEVAVLDLKNIAVGKGKAPPSLVTMTLSVKTMPDPKTRQNEVIAVACLVSGKFQVDKATPPKLYQEHFVALTKSSQSILPYNFKDVAEKQGKQYNLEVLPSERALLGFLLAKIHKYDPDVLIGHDIYGFDLDILIHRITVNKVPHWSKVSRLKRSHPPKTGQGRAAHVDRSAVCGRILCDLKVSARELIRCKSYDLTELTNHILHLERRELDAEALVAAYSSSQQLLSLVECCLQDAFFVLKMVYELQALQLAWEISSICGNLVTRTLLGGRSERNEYLLLHAFTERDFIVPDKCYGKRPAASHVPIDEDIDVDENVAKEASGAVRGKRKPAYAGGLVLDPKRGFYDKFILLVDFNSLYPSIIREFNICFTTVDHQACSMSEPKGDDYEEALPSLPDNLDEGVLPAQLRILVDCRREAKNALKKPNLPADERTRQDIRQKALKLTANSMYGCLGFTFSRFYAKPLAALVTSKGREILLKTKDMVQNMGLDVIYGDTDSLMINTNCTDIEEIMKIGNKVKGTVNKLYKHLEIEIDGIFKSMLLLKKKKYAALSLTKCADGTYSETREMKGLDIVRRDWCELAKEAGKFVVDEILSGKAKDQILDTIHSELREVGERVRRGEVPSTLFHITKQLTKNPQDYPDKRSLPHVQVALRRNSGIEKKLKAGDTVYYVICCDGSNQAATQRAYHPDELSKNEYLTIDTHYYLSQQVHPVVSRLLEPIEGTDAALIAECLGLDASGYRHKVGGGVGGETEEMLTLQLSEEEKYRDCQRLIIKCYSCGVEKIYEHVFEGEKSSLSCSVMSCSNKQCSISPVSNLSYLMNHLTRVLRGHIQRYYQTWLKCSDAACGSRTRALPALTSGGRPICSACNAAVLVPECTDLSLYTQLCYYESLFDLEKGKQLLPKEDRAIADRVSNEYKTEYKKLKAHVSKFVRQCAYADVDLSKLFHGLFG